MGSNRKRKWGKIALLCLLMVVVAGIPLYTIKADSNSARALLKKTITYCETLKESEYTAKTWKVFQKELKTSKSVYDKKKQKESVYATQRDALEEAKANLMFVAAKDNGNPLPFRQLTVDQIVDEMGAGWNLGNTMDGHSGLTPSETAWQNVITTKALIKSVHDMGFNTIRIPVTWGTMIDDNNNYKIDEAWMSRVQDIIDYCISQDMYTIITVFHDGAEQMGWIRISADDIDPVYDKYEQVWRQIADRFKDYDEHLIFESMNEVTGNGTTLEHDMQVVMNMNQIFTNIVRTSGSNNSERWLSVPGRYTNINNTTKESLGFDIPKDTVKNRIFVSVHEYDYSFGLQENLGITKYSLLRVQDLAEMCQQLVERFTSKGIPVILGEYGAVNKNNTAERAYHYEAFTRICQLDGVVACVWDQGWYDLSHNPDYSFALVDRTTKKELYPDIIDAIMRGTFLPAKSDDFTDIVKSPTITKISSLSLSDTSLAMTIGDSKEITTTVKPTDTNDIVVWKTADSAIATVQYGHVRARGIGSTTLTAFSRSGSVKETVRVTVKAKVSDKSCTSINVEKDSYDLVKGDYIYLNVNLMPADTEDFVYYKSSDESVATVSTIGKVLACGKGTATITITASNGLTKTIKVNVGLNELSSTLELGLFVYFNDPDAGYYASELGETVKVTGNGQYTLTFDIGKNLSKAGKSKKVTGLNNVGAIYLKDVNVHKHKIVKSPVSTCNIKYDKIVVDGVELTINQKAPKSALRDSGVFDTNDPINAYDGSLVEEVSAENDILNFTTIQNPQKITITFTLSDIVFTEGTN